MTKNRFLFELANKEETRKQLLEKFNNTQNNKPFVRMDCVMGKVAYKWYKSYEAALKQGLTLTKEEHFAVCIVSKDKCVFFDEL